MLFLLKSVKLHGSPILPKKTYLSQNIHELLNTFLYGMSAHMYMRVCFICVIDVLTVFNIYTHVCVSNESNNITWWWWG